MATTRTLVNNLALWSSLLGMLAFLMLRGFELEAPLRKALYSLNYLVLGIGMLSTVQRDLQRRHALTTRVLLFDALTLLYTVAVALLHILPEDTLPGRSFLRQDWLVQLAVLFTFIREFSEVRVRFSRQVLDPAQLFILSFLSIILAGALLLMLPNATQSGISFTDALFTSTSAVCVTGLIVVDTATFFTPFGQGIILLLIQVGGLGILTFTSYFAFFFRGTSSFENQLVLSDLTSSRKIGEVFDTLKRILLITFIVEGAAALLILTSLDPRLFDSFADRVWFAGFHAISAFCNAGFSTLTNNLYEEGFRFNYALHIIVALTIVLGGLGFPIVANTVAYMRHLVLRFWPFTPNVRTYRPWVLNLNSRIILSTTTLLVVIGTLLLYLTEYDHTLKPHSGFGKWVTAFFASVTPRTAGFNSVDMTALSVPTLWVTIFLMWIGASPLSTGGGIKTSTFAVAIMNILSLAKGKTRIEIYRREISDMTMRRAFATIALSLAAISVGILLIGVFDPRLDPLHVAFECFSAYSTVGLSVGITPSLTLGSKLVLIALMFAGRVSLLTIVIALFAQERYKNYRYPTEEITIN